MNLANKLTLLRIILVPVFLVFLIGTGIPYGKTIATVIFIIASITDKVDGYIARSRNMVTNFGKFMDPLADKLLVTAALICFVELGIVPSWAAIIIIAREFAVSGLRSIAASQGKVIAASWWGKIKTVIQIVAILCLLVKANVGEIDFLDNLAESSAGWHIFINTVPNFMLLLAVIITIVSGIDYFRKNKEVLSVDK